MAGAGAGTPSVSMSLIEPSSTEKSTLVTVAGCANRAFPSLVNLSSTVPGDPRTVGTTLRATLSSAARTCTTATMFTVNAKSTTAGYSAVLNTDAAYLIHGSHGPRCGFTRPGGVERPD